MTPAPAGQPEGVWTGSTVTIFIRLGTKRAKSQTFFGEASVSGRTAPLAPRTRTGCRGSDEGKRHRVEWLAAAAATADHGGQAWGTRGASSPGSGSLYLKFSSA